MDLNRAGTGLMEIVTEPDMRCVLVTDPKLLSRSALLTKDHPPRSAEEAGTFVRKLQSLLRRLNSGDGDMEKVSKPCPIILLVPH